MARGSDVDPSGHESSTLDVRQVPLWHRLPMILGAVDQLEPGATLELVADLDPWPLREVLAASRARLVLDWEVMDAGPETWRIRVSRRG
jgi:uncharacterized protein (DUF2249 family)